MTYALLQSLNIYQYVFPGNWTHDLGIASVTLQQLRYRNTSAVTLIDDPLMILWIHAYLSSHASVLKLLLLKKSQHILQIHVNADCCLFIPQNHQFHCPRFPVQCPNQCGTPNIAREDLPNHVKESCGSALVLCPFKEAGCKHRVSPAL